MNRFRTAIECFSICFSVSLDYYFFFFGFHDVAAVVDMVYQCSGRNDPVAKA